ncbi:PTS sugar transporter subunit IIA [Oceanivirga miroungae]|uniref:PTS system fructose subfamily transporter subunit IIC n=1 Tax=Oceanivirga miroungae TaxID=1130046 RepID=A0A6I8M5P9_9FUSO|nr:PTS sugar transporter subunit IIA [Oceanivirga miroungae]VWL85259.1 PTS system fructose subfamily transporter subunit IIC [Oceanivirga miroungae]
MNKVSDVDTIVLDLDVKDKIDIFKLVAKKAKELNIIEDEEKVIEEFIEKEKDTETYLGSKCAMPHIKTNIIGSSVIFYIRLKNEMLWSGKDSAKYIFLIISNREDVEKHLKLLRLISKIIMKNDILKIFKESDDTLKISNTINEIE